MNECGVKGSAYLPKMDNNFKECVVVISSSVEYLLTMTFVEDGSKNISFNLLEERNHHENLT